ncbi:class IIb bacteriocin, lactobin A/cerein 7B family [Aquimarina longa]|uniref:class IIb bacteriocin, lactobin A/cerein 7B family n=1 Tax=Aquimarina longa TaxID=1080221 RepID=UPI0007824E01|nr:class IIb bacteriocin, lactobin A/cerein 7B family [Aquimarina longa]
MNFTEKQKEANQFLQQIITKAWEDKTFKQELISLPELAIEKITGEKINLPENIKIVVEDQTDSNVVYLNIPRKYEIDELELTDEQLEMVAGGIFPAIIAGLALGAALKKINNKYDIF